jgi:CRISPR-associated protein Cmr2
LGGSFTEVLATVERKYALIGAFASVSNTHYTAISFAPVQGFIEKSRKLRDLYGASLILSYLSQKIIEEFHHSPDLEVISPGLIHVQEGMPNRILIKGFIDRDRVQQTVLKHWQHLLKVCREWVEKYVPAEYHWSQTGEQIGKEKGEWERWGSYTWEIFWGKGDDPQSAMDDLETRKLKRDWTAINWMGESSSLSGTDAIAWTQLGRRYEQGDYQPGRSLTQAEQEEQELFYRRLSWLLDDPKQRIGKPHKSLAELRAYEKSDADGIGRYIAVNERLSIPELVKRLITYDKIDADTPDGEKLDIAKLKKKPEDPEFKDIYREPGYWTGWFMGDGDKVGDKLKQLAELYPDNPEQRDQALKRFSELMRGWGGTFEAKKDLFPDGKGRIIYAGGDDFLGVLYSEQAETKREQLKPVKPIEAWDWLLKLPKEWEQLQADLKKDLTIDFSYSVGFVWAGNRVPQRDVLQHCREAEKRSKNLGRDRVTIRVVFNSGQYVQWTCPWDHLDILQRYRDRDGGHNWTHVYKDWATLKARHAIRLTETDKQDVDAYLARQLLDLYFDNTAQRIEKNPDKNKRWKYCAGDNSELAIVQWMDDLILVGWQLCSNT